MVPNVENFNKIIQVIFELNLELQNEWVDIKAGNIHQLLGSYPGSSHRIKTCCEVMYKIAKTRKHEIIYSPKKSFGASLTIRYYL